jgi:undecaprenyl-phosphate 4-deoxy-4-formamido-L-arabinose transferase
MQMLTGFSVVPLRVASILGFFFSISGFIIALWLVFFKSITSETPVGWTSLLIVILFLGGIQLVALGVIGEFLGRIYLAANNYPQFSIKKTINTKIE